MPRADDESRLVVHAERILKKTGARNHARSAVDREEDENHGRRNDAQHVLFVFKAVRKVVGERERVVRLFGIDAKARCHELPVEPGADDQSDRNPALRNAVKEDGARETHEEPPAHVGGAHRERGHEAPETAAAQNEVGVVAGVVIGKDPDEHHQDQVADKSYGSRIRKHLRGALRLSVFIGIRFFDECGQQASAGSIRFFRENPGAPAWVESICARTPARLRVSS